MNKTAFISSAGQDVYDRLREEIIIHHGSDILDQEISKHKTPDSVIGALVNFSESKYGFDFWSSQFKSQGGRTCNFEDGQ